MTESAPSFYWSDAWLLMALAFAADQGVASLSAVIQLADGIQHAVISREELNGGIGRLQRADYLTWSSAGLSITIRGRALVAGSGGDRASHSVRQAAIEKALAAIPLSADLSPDMALGGEPELISVSDYRAAVHQHRR